MSDKFNPYISFLRNLANSNWHADEGVFSLFSSLGVRKVTYFNNLSYAFIFFFSFLFHQLLDGFAELIHGAFFSLPDILHNAGFDVAGKQYLVEAV